MPNKVTTAAPVARPRSAQPQTPAAPAADATWSPRSAARPRAAGSTGTQRAQAAAPAAATEGFSPTGVTVTQLRRIMPSLSSERATQLLPHLNRAMAEFGIDTPQRAAAFLAQVAHESGQLQYFEELASGSAYEGRRDLGNTEAGDGRRFKGRGPIQLTGRANYEAAGRALGIDLVNNPQLAARPDIGFRLAGWFWQRNNLNRLADNGQFDQITRRINGGYNGAADRRQFHARAWEVLGGGLSGGPQSTSDTPVPEYVSPSGRSHDFRSRTFENADPETARFTQSYAQRAFASITQTRLQLFYALLRDVSANLDRSDPELQAFAASLGIPPGAEIPDSVVQEFAAQKIATTANAHPQGADAGLKEMQRSMRGAR